MATWFCDAYASSQKGGIENADGRLRRWLPRQINIDRVSDEEIQDIVLTANLTPRVQNPIPGHHWLYELSIHMFPEDGCLHV
jgi:IS30 family transposase